MSQGGRVRSREGRGFGGKLVSEKWDRSGLRGGGGKVRELGKSSAMKYNLPKWLHHYFWDGGGVGRIGIILIHYNGLSSWNINMLPPYKTNTCVEYKHSWNDLPRNKSLQANVFFLSSFLYLWKWLCSLCCYSSNQSKHIHFLLRLISECSMMMITI